MQRKSTKNTRGPNAEEKAFQAWLKQRPCCITGRYGVHVHHVKGSCYKHNKLLIGHRFCLPLHPDEHRKIHANKKEWRRTNGPEWRHWIILADMYWLQTGISIPRDIIDTIKGCV